MQASSAHMHACIRHQPLELCPSNLCSCLDGPAAFIYITQTLAPSYIYTYHLYLTSLRACIPGTDSHPATLHSYLLGFIHVGGLHRGLGHFLRPFFLALPPHRVSICRAPIFPVVGLLAELVAPHPSSCSATLCNQFAISWHV